MKRSILLLLALSLLLPACQKKAGLSQPSHIPPVTAAPYKDTRVYDYTPMESGPQQMLVKKRVAVARFEDKLPVAGSPFGKYQKMPDGSVVISSDKEKEGNSEIEDVRIEAGQAAVLEGKKGLVNPRFHAMVINELLKTRRFTVIERQDINALLREIQFGQSKWVNREQAAKVGKQLGAQLIITGSFGYNADPTAFAGSPFSLFMRIYDVNTGRVVASQRSVGQTPFELIRNGVATLVFNAEQIPWSALVANVRGEYLYINEGLASNLEVGDTLLIYSLGRAIYDPADRETVLGYEEDLAGEGEVVNVEEKVSKVRVIKSQRSIKIGDKVKMLAKKGDAL